MKVLYLHMIRVMQEYLIPIIKKYEIWEALADFLSIDPEDGPATLFDDLSRFEWEVNEEEYQFVLLGTYQDDRILRFAVKLYPKLNGDPHFLQSLTINSSLLEDPNEMETFLLGTYPVLGEGGVVECIETHVSVNGFELYDTYNHILRRDAEVPSITCLVKSDIVEESSPGSEGYWIDSVPVINEPPVDPEKLLASLSEDLFPVPLMYHVLKETVEKLHLNSRSFSGVTIFSVPYDRSLTKEVEYDKQSQELRYIVSGFVQDNDGTDFPMRVSAAWQILSNIGSGLCPIQFLPKYIHMTDESSGTTVHCIAKLNRWKIGGPEISISTNITIGESTNRSETGSVFTNIIPLPTYDKCVDLYEIYRNDSDLQNQVHLDPVYEFATRQCSSESIPENQMNAHIVRLFHEHALRWLPDYVINDLEYFLLKLGLLEDGISSVLSKIFETGYDHDGKIFCIIHPIDDDIFRLIQEQFV